MTPSVIKEWVDLLSWELIAFLALLLFAPVVMLNLHKLSLEWGDKKISFAQQRAKEAESAAVDVANTQNAATAAADVQEIPEDAADVRDDERLENIIKAWLAIAVIARDKAMPIGGKPGLNSAMPNLRLLKEKRLVEERDIETALDLQRKRNQYRNNPEQRISSTQYRSFVISAAKLAKKLSEISVQAAA